LGFRVWGLGFRIQGLGFRAWSLGSRDRARECVWQREKMKEGEREFMVYGLWFMVHGSRVMVHGLGLRV